MESDGITRQSATSQIKHLVASSSGQKNQSRLDKLKPLEAPGVLESFPPARRALLWELFNESQQCEIIQHFEEDVVLSLLSDKSGKQIATVLEQTDDDETADILQRLSADLIQEVLTAMDLQDRSRIENLLAYPENTAGGILDTDTISLRPGVTSDVFLRYLRRHSALPSMTDSILVVNSTDAFVGVPPLAVLLVSNPTLTVGEIMVIEIEAIPADMSEHDVAAKFERYDLVSAPVIDQKNKLLGRLTIDDVVDVSSDEADHSILGMAGLNEDSGIFDPMVKTAKSQAIWLGANFIMEFIAASVVDVFKKTKEKVIALAVLMPTVASMSGVAAGQGLTLVIRNMAQDESFDNNFAWLTPREVAVGAINGCIWSLVVAGATSMFFNAVNLGLTIATALVINLLTAALSRTLLPSLLNSLRIDPAIAGAAVLTTITDVVRFPSILGFATLFCAQQSHE